MHRVAIVTGVLTPLVFCSGVWCSRVWADDTGFAYTHTLRKEGGRLCMADHFHSGSGTGRTKAAA